MHETRSNSLVRMFAALLLLGGSPAFAAPEIVDAAYVEEAAGRGAIIWDVRSPRAYVKGHIPGAVNLGKAGAVLRDPVNEDFLPTETVEKIFNQAGIDLGKEIIVYGETGSPYPHWGLITLRHFGAENGRVYNGGMDDWRTSGKPVSTEPARLEPVSQKLTVKPGVLIYTEEVLAKLEDPDVQFVDVRTPGEYAGLDIRALRGGHLPGAVNLPYEQNWVDPDTYKKLRAGKVKTREGARLKTEEQLRALYAGLDPARETVVYCQSGVRASETANVLRALGFDKVRVYEESWLGYGNTLDAPAESVRFVNVGRLKKRIAGLEAAVAELMGKLNAMAQPAK